MDEKWLPVNGYEGLYEISSLGRVRGKSGVIKLGVDRKGYVIVSLSKKSSPKKRYVAKLVLETFVGPRPMGHVVCHGPAGKTDNSVSNLCWGTWSKNMGDDRVRDGVSNRGERNGMSKLTEIDVKFIRHWLKSGFDYKQIAKVFGVSRQTVSGIKFGHRWSWVK